MANLINDAIIGGNGNDVLTGDEGNDLIKGLAGNDTLSGLDGKDTIYGGDDNDLILGGNDVDSLYGNAGDDVVVGNKGNDRMIGNAGDDILGWADGDGSDRMSGNAGYDTVAVTGSVEKGDDFVLAQDGNKAIFDRVNLGKFTLTVDSAEKFDVEGLGGDDKFTVKDLSNTDVKLVKFSGGAGNDWLNGKGTDTPIKAYGDAGNDTLKGGEGNDTLVGGAGNDLLVGNGGNDVLIGGNSPDTFGFSLKSNGVSTIKNFVSGSDQIKIDLAGGLDVNEYAVVDNNAAAAISNALVTYSVGTGDLFYNQNGSQAGYGDGGQFATLEGTNTLAYTDFTVS
jgi:Ca2+-binding RTX toxin-like protein